MSQLAIRIKKSGISTMAQVQLASHPQSLPPILHIFIPTAVSSYSKGPRGLSVLPRVGGIFTSTTISLDSWSRQLPSRYAIHAGRYLIDKEFRYLRTVIVTAAVYWGFDQWLRLRYPHQLTFQHRAGVTPYTSSYELAECCVFGKQSGGTLCCNLFRFLEQVHIQKEAHLIPKIRCYFAEFLNQISSTRLRILISPTCVGLRYEQ